MVGETFKMPLHCTFIFIYLYDIYMTYIYIPIFIFILYLDIERFHYFYFGRKCLKDKNLFWKPGVPLFIWKFTVNPISKYKTILLKANIQTNRTRSWWRLRCLRSKIANRIRINQNHKTKSIKGHVPLSFLQWVINLTSLVTKGNVTSHNNLFKWPCDFMVGSPSP